VTLRTSVLPLGFGLSAVLCFGPAAPADEPPPRPERPPARVYTNEDLARVHPFRSETGVDSVPAFKPGPPERESRSGASRAGSAARGEPYWRREAEKARGRMRTLVDQAETLRARIAAREDERRQATRQGRGRSSAGATADTTATLRAQLASVERRMRELEDDLAERARREGALPGWLR
jgi:hypothetical protein